jgi:hypothetical protein
MKLVPLIDQQHIMEALIDLCEVCHRPTSIATCPKCGRHIIGALGLYYCECSGRCLWFTEDDKTE